MTFEEVLDQAIAMLPRGRVTYRTLASPTGSRVTIIGR
jgi:hypothetical protein